MKVNDNSLISKIPNSMNVAASPPTPASTIGSKDSYVLSEQRADFSARLRPAPRPHPRIPRPVPAPTPVPGPSETQCPEGLPAGFWHGDLQVDGQSHPLIVTEVDMRTAEDVLRQLQVCESTPMIAFRHTVLGHSYWLIMPRSEFPVSYSQICNGQIHSIRLLGAGPILTLPISGAQCPALSAFEARGVVLRN